MKFLIDKIFGSDKPKPPDKIEKSFKKLFGKFKNDEWVPRNKDWEVVFYLDDRENIGLFDENGHLKELKAILNLDQLPATLLGHIQPLGEIMNIIEIEGESGHSYEIIYRDEKLVRHLQIIDDQGNLLHQKVL